MTNSPKPKNPGGRPPIKLDLARIRILCNMQASTQEIADIIGCGRSTLDHKLGPTMVQWRAEGLETIRFYQWQALKRGSTQMALRLGEIYLPEQRDIQNNAPQFTQINVSRVSPRETEIHSDPRILEQVPSEETIDQ